MKSNYSILPVFWKAEELKFNGMLTLSRRKTEQDFYAHAHDYFKLEYILSGKGVHWLNGKAYPMAPGSFYLLTPTDVHALQVEEPLELYNISFSEQILLGSPLNESLLRSSGTHLQLSDKEGQRKAHNSRKSQIIFPMHYCMFTDIFANRSRWRMFPP